MGREEHIKNPSIVAIDSNVFISLVRISSNYHAKPKQQGFNENLRIMKRKCESGTLKLVILPSVFAEIYPRLNNKETDFLREHCLVLEPDNEKAYSKECYELAKSYVREGIMKGEKGNPSMDAIIMAEATVAGLNLVTNNSRDFLAYEKNDKNRRKDCKDKSQRATDIAKFNKKEGFVFKTKKGETYSPKPYSSSQYVMFFKTTGAFDMREKYSGVKFYGG